MSTPVGALLSRLDGVSPRGPGRWFARCPSHEDGRPSLSVQERDDGTLLVHCFAGCGAAEIVAAVGMSLADLFVKRHPDADVKGYRNRPPPFSARDVLLVLDHESLIVAAVAADIVAGREIKPVAVERVNDARMRIARVREVCRV